MEHLDGLDIAYIVACIVFLCLAHELWLPFAKALVTEVNPFWYIGIIIASFAILPVTGSLVISVMLVLASMGAVYIVVCLVREP